MFEYYKNQKTIFVHLNIPLFILIVNSDGLRTTKTVNGSKTEYQYVGDKLFYEKRGDGNSFYYFYDSYGKLSAIYHHVNGTQVPYHVVTNAQGDIMALYNWSGDTKVAEYSYDAWGNCTIVSDTTSTHIATLNPFRYRGYYRDTDLGLYYLQSRYYDSEIGRFINADNQFSGVGGSVHGYNMYSYCMNNPVNLCDPTGHWSKLAERVSFVASCVAIAAAAIATVAAVATLSPLAPLAISLLTISVGGFVDGIANASEKNSFSNGYVGGVSSNATQEIVDKVSSGNPLVSSTAGFAGTVVGTSLTLELNNIDPYSSNLPSHEIKNRAIKSGSVSAATSFGSSIISSGVDIANQEGCLMPGYTPGFGYALKTFFNVLDDAINFVWG